MKTIYEYLDFRAFLRDIFAEKKKRNAHYSWRFISQHLQVKSPSYILMIIQGKKKLSVELMDRIADFLKLKQRPREYFRLLVMYAQAKNEQEKQRFFESIVTLRRRRIKHVAPEHYEFYEKWYYAAVREIVAIMPVHDNDAPAIARCLRPSITTSQVRDALEVLQRLGLITRNREGRYERTDATLTTGDEWDSAAIHATVVSLAELGKQALTRFPKSQRDISALTLSVSEKTFETIRRKTAEFRSELLALASADTDADRVLQCNLQIFPLFDNTEKDSTHGTQP